MSSLNFSINNNMLIVILCKAKEGGRDGNISMESQR